MRRWLAIVLFALGGACAHSQTGAIQGHSFLGGTQAKTQGLASSNYLDGIVPTATITVYLTGTTTKATIFADTSGTPLANPFTSNTPLSVNPGGWIFWAATGQGYDIVASGGIAPNAYPAPVTLCTDCFPSSQFTVDTGVTGVAGQSPCIANGVSGAFETGNVTVFCPGSSFQAQNVPQLSGQYVMVYPQTCTASGSGSCNTNNRGGTIVAGSTLHLTNFNVPACASAYTGVVVQVLSTRSIPNSGGGAVTLEALNNQGGGSFTGINSGSHSLAPPGTSDLNSFDSLWAYLTASGANAPTNINAIDVQMTFSNIGSGSQSWNEVGLQVYYTGTACPGSGSGVNIAQPLNWNPTTNTLSDPTPGDAPLALDYSGSTTAYTAVVGAFASNGPNLGSIVTFVPQTTNTTTTPTLEISNGSNTSAEVIVNDDAAGDAPAVGSFVGGQSYLFRNDGAHWRWVSGGSSGSGTVSGQANGVLSLGCAATSICAQAHIDEVTNPGSETSTQPIIVSGSTHGITVPSGTQVAGVTGKVVYGADSGSAGLAEVNENGAGWAHVCTAANAATNTGCQASGGGGNYVDLGGSPTTWSGCTYASGECVAGSATATITISNIPTTYSNLIVNVNGGSSTSTQVFNLQLNADTAADYGWNRQGTSGANASADTVAQVCVVGDSASQTGGGTITILNANSTASIYKVINAQCTAATGSLSFVGFTWYAGWNGTAAITSITLTLTGGSAGGSGNFTAGTTVSIYGTN